jgi:hypothetical protein
MSRSRSISFRYSGFFIFENAVHASLQKHKDTPLVLHTLPVAQSSSSASLSACTLSVPRLISVVEIIKREYLKTLKGCETQGLHQYNEIASLKESCEVDLAQALEGKNQ